MIARASDPSSAANADFWKWEYDLSNLSSVAHMKSVSVVAQADWGRRRLE